LVVGRLPHVGPTRSTHMFLVPKPHMFRKWSNMAHGKNYFHEKKLHHLGKIKQGSDSERMKGTTILVWSGDYIFCTCTL
jgi:hypothetical protein